MSDDDIEEIKMSDGIGGAVAAKTACLPKVDLRRKIRADVSLTANRRVFWRPGQAFRRRLFLAPVEPPNHLVDVTDDASTSGTDVLVFSNAAEVFYEGHFCTAW